MFELSLSGAQHGIKVPCLCWGGCLGVKLQLVRSCNRYSGSPRGPPSPSHTLHELVPAAALLTRRTSRFTPLPACTGKAACDAPSVRPLLPTRRLFRSSGCLERRIAPEMRGCTTKRRISVAGATPPTSPCRLRGGWCAALSASHPEMCWSTCLYKWAGSVVRGARRKLLPKKLPYSS